jgi:glutamate-1-semialdehyde 2,1-aminomutase
LNKISGEFTAILKDVVRPYGITVQSIGSMFSLFFRDKPVRNFNDVMDCDLQRFRDFYLRMLERGIYFSPSQFETNFVSWAHKRQDFKKTLTNIKNVF